ncbi:MAG: preprotein translocase subunit YajC [Acidimicrobiales bacterium]
MAAFLFLLLPVALWVALVRPQQQRMRRAQALVASVEEGDEVITAGGIYGTVTDMDDTSLWLEVAPGVIVRVARAAVSSRVTAPGDELGDDRVDDDRVDDDRVDEDEDGAVEDEAVDDEPEVHTVDSARAADDDA